VWNYLYNLTFSRFNTIPECDRHTDRQTHDDGIYHAGIASRGTMLVLLPHYKLEIVRQN